jgi:hypothetical protein
MTFFICLVKIQWFADFKRQAYFSTLVYSRNIYSESYVDGKITNEQSLIHWQHSEQDTEQRQMKNTTQKMKKMSNKGKPQIWCHDFLKLPPNAMIFCSKILWKQCYALLVGWSHLYKNYTVTEILLVTHQEESYKILFQGHFLLCDTILCSSIFCRIKLKKNAVTKRVMVFNVIFNSLWHVVVIEW